MKYTHTSIGILKWQKYPKFKRIKNLYFWSSTLFLFLFYETEIISNDSNDRGFLKFMAVYNYVLVSK